MNFKAVDNRKRTSNGVKRLNQQTTWGTILVANGEPCLLVDGVFYDIPFTKDIASQVKYVVNTELNKKIINPYIKRNNMALINYEGIEDISKYWSYVYTGQKVRCNKADNKYIVNLNFLNTYMEKEYIKLCEEHKDYDKLTYISNARLSSH